MENVESPTKPSPLNLSTRPSIERNVLKELNNLEGATKSPKQALATDQLDTRTKDPASFPNNLPDIVTNVHSDGNKAVAQKANDVQSSDDEYAECNTTFKSSVSPVNNTFDVACDLNDTIDTSDKVDQTVNESKDAEVCVSNRKLNLGFIEIRNSLVTDSETEKLIVNKLKEDDESVTGNPSEDTTISSHLIRQPVAYDPNCTVTVDQCVDVSLVCAQDRPHETIVDTPACANEDVTVSTFPSESIIELQPVAELESERVVKSDPVIEEGHNVEVDPVTKAEHATEEHPLTEADPAIEPDPVTEGDLVIYADPVTYADTVTEADRATEADPVTIADPITEAVRVIEPDFVAEADRLIESQPENQSILVIKTDLAAETQSVIASLTESESAIGLEISTKTQLVIDSETVIQSEAAVDLQPDSDTATVIELATPIIGILNNVFPQKNNAEDQLSCNASEKGLQIDVEANDFNDGSSTCGQDIKFTSTNNETNQTVLSESGSLKPDDEIETALNISPTESKGLNDGSELNQEIDEFNPAPSKVSLEPSGETQDCSLDSLEMEQDEPLTPTDKHLSSIAADKIFSSRKAPKFSEMFPNLEPATNELNNFTLNKQSDESFVVEKTDLTNEKSPNKPSDDGSFNFTERLMRQDTFDVTTPVVADFEFPAKKNVNGSISKFCRQETYSVPLAPHKNDSASVDDVTVLLNKVSIKSPTKIDSNDRLQRSGTFEISTVAGDSKKSQLSSEVLPICSSKGSELEDKVSRVSMPAPNMTNNEQVPDMVLNSNDFDFLQSRGAKSADPDDDRRSSLLLRFDPLSGRSTQKPQFAPTAEIAETATEVEKSFRETNPPQLCNNISKQSTSDEHQSSQTPSAATNATEMSVGLVHDTNNMDNDTDAYNIQTDDKHIGGDVPLSDKKIKFEYADGNIRKKMEEYEATQEILVKRLTEKDKTLSKNGAIIEAYEKALAELVAEKEKLTENYEVVNEKLRQERDIHHQHLMSLENTFSDLHKKYERSKEFAMQLQERLDLITEEKAKIDELLKRQESRYEKMKQHALHQLEYANSTLEEQEKNNSRENSRLKALLKIEEVSRNTIQEQFLQKCKENEELVKICDELIGGQKS